MSNPSAAGGVNPVQELATQRGAVLNEAVARANREPLPGALDRAFGPEGEIVVGAFKVRKVVHADYPILKRLNSPLYRQMLEGSNEEIKPEHEELFELCYQFTRPCREVRETLNKGREFFREVATQTFGDAPIEDGVLTAVFTAVVEQFTTSMSTMQAHTSKEEGKELPFQADSPPPKTA